MIQLDEKDLQKRFEEIPDALALALVSPELNESIQKIARNYSIVGDNLDNLEILISLTFLGEKHVQDFPDELNDILDFPDETIEDISEEVYAIIFSRYMDDLVIAGDKFAHGDDKGDNGGADTDNKTVTGGYIQASSGVQQPTYNQPCNQIPPHINNPQLTNVQPHDLPNARVIPPHEPVAPTAHQSSTSYPQPPQAQTPSTNYSVEHVVQNQVPNQNNNPVPMPSSPRPAPWNTMSSGNSFPQQPKEPSILIQQVEPIHNLDHEPAIPEHDEDLMPMIIQNSKYVQQQRQAPSQPAPTQPQYQTPPKSVPMPPTQQNWAPNPMQPQMPTSQAPQPQQNWQQVPPQNQVQPSQQPSQTQPTWQPAAPQYPQTQPPQPPQPQQNWQPAPPPVPEPPRFQPAPEKNPSAPSWPHNDPYREPID